MMLHAVYILSFRIAEYYCEEYCESCEPEPASKSSRSSFLLALPPPYPAPDHGEHVE